MPETQVSITDKALSRLGIARFLQGDVDGTLASCTDDSTVKQMADIWFQHALDRLIEDHPWPFATRFQRLVLVTDQCNDVPDPDELWPWGGEWLFAYAYPTECKRARKFRSESMPFGSWWFQRGFDTWFWPDERAWAFIVREHVDTNLPDTDPLYSQKVILTNVVEDLADLEFTREVTDPAELSATAQDGLIWTLAYELSLAVKVDERFALRAKEEAMAGSWRGMAYAQNEQIEARPSGLSDPREHGEYLGARGGR